MANERVNEGVIFILVIGENLSKRTVKFEAVKIGNTRRLLNYQYDVA